jgi:hypothetical protein
MRRTYYPDVELILLLMKAVEVLLIDTSAWPPVSSNGPGHARYRRLVVTDRANARRMANHYGQALQESLPWATVTSLVEYVDEATGSELVEGLQVFRLILIVRTNENSPVGESAGGCDGESWPLFLL